MPIAGELYAKNRSSDLGKTYQVLTRWIFAATLPVFFILFFFPEMTITFLFGEKFRRFRSSSPYIVPRLSYLRVHGSNSMMLLVMGHTKEVIKVSAAGALLNILLNYILIKHAGLGLRGAALSSLVSFFAISCGYSFFLYRHSGIASDLLRLPEASHRVCAHRNSHLCSCEKPAPVFLDAPGLFSASYIFGYIASLIFTRSLHNEDIFLFREFMNSAGVASETTNRIIGKYLMQMLKTLIRRENW